NEEICGNTANTYGTSTHRGSDDVPYGLDKEHKCSFVRKKGRRTGSHLLRKQSSTGAELNYPGMENLILALVHVAKRLRRYFQAHMITVLTNLPIKQTLTKPEKSGRVAKWAIELGEHDFVFQERGDESPKDFLIEVPLEDNKKEAEEKADTKLMKTELSCEWKLFTDGDASSDDSGAGLMLIDPEGKEYTYALRFGFETTNNKAEYEALLVRLRISQEMEITSLAIFVDSQLLVNQIKEHIRRNQNKKADTLSKLASMTFEHLTKEVLVEVLPKQSIEEKEILQVETKEGESWVTPIHEYLVSGLLPKDPKESRKIRVKAPQYKLIRGNLYRRSFYTPWLRCVASPQIDDIIKEVLQDCEKCKEQFAIRKVAESSAITAGSGWPFSHWGVNILGPLPTALGDLCKGLKVTQSFFPITEHMEIMNHIEKQLARSQQGWVDALAQVLWVHRTLPRNSQKETPFSLTYGSEAIIPLPENDVAKDDRGRIKEVDKRRGNKEIASIEEAYYQSKLRRHHSERSSHSIYKIRDFVLLSQSNAGGTQEETSDWKLEQRMEYLFEKKPRGLESSKEQVFRELGAS
ncbi:reverse transcriptase domain-containing protein, partial [Tanacetum coccineum]